MRVLISKTVETRFGAELRAAAPWATMVLIDDDAQISDDIEDAEVVYFSQDMWAASERLELRHAGGQWRTRRVWAFPSLRWVHMFTSQRSYPQFFELQRRGGQVTYCPGVTSGTIAEYVVTMILHALKPVAAWRDAQSARRWNKVETEDLCEKTVGIVGLGNIGTAVAQRLAPFGCRVIATRRHPRPSELAEEVLPPEGLGRLLGESDFVVLALASSHESPCLIDADAVTQMRPGAWLINVTRAKVVDHGAVTAAVTSGSLGGAVFDVHGKEPLPPDDPAWDASGVILTPHNASFSSRHLRGHTRIFIDNLRRWGAGEPLVHRADSPP